MKMYIIISLIIILNLFAFFMFYSDKKRAIKKSWRISENFLITLIFLFPIGSVFGMYIFHHKTKKTKFKICYVLSILVHAFLVYFIYIKHVIKLTI